MIVFRLEDDRGRGPFSSAKRWPEGYDGEKAIHNLEGCTVPDEKYGYDSSSYRFGCRNITQLKKYWGNQLEKFAKDGWVIATYSVRKNYVLFSTKDIELAFKAEKAVRIYE